MLSLTLLEEFWQMKLKKIFIYNFRRILGGIDSKTVIHNFSERSEGYTFKKLLDYFLKSFRFIEKLSRKYKEFPYTRSPQYTHFYAGCSTHIKKDFISLNQMCIIL